MKRKKHRLTMFIWFCYFYYRITHAHCNTFKQYKEKRSSLFSVFPSRPTGQGNQYSRFSLCSSSFFLARLTLEVSLFPLDAFMFVSSCLRARPLIISLFFLKVMFPCVPCEKQSYVTKGRVGEIGCRVAASIADARFLSGAVALAPHSSPGASLLFLPYLGPGNPLLCSCPQHSHSEGFLSMCLAHITA